MESEAMASLEMARELKLMAEQPPPGVTAWKV